MSDKTVSDFAGEPDMWIRAVDVDRTTDRVRTRRERWVNGERVIWEDLGE